MNHQYTATILWKSDGAAFFAGKYSRTHTWRFDCGIEIDASASPSVVPLPYSREDAVDPEEAYVAAISSCHMLTFLYFASKQAVEVLSYTDCAVGYMEASSNGKLSVTRVVLNPEIEYVGEPPSKSIIDSLHHLAHEECFIANSVKTVIEMQGS